MRPTDRKSVALFVKQGCRLRHSPFAVQIIFSSLFGQLSATRAFLWMVSKRKFPRSFLRTKSSPIRNFEQKRNLIFELLKAAMFNLHTDAIAQFCAFLAWVRCPRVFLYRFSIRSKTNKLISVCYASVLLLMINCVITLSKRPWNHEPQGVCQMLGIYERKEVVNSPSTKICEFYSKWRQQFQHFSRFLIGYLR